MQHIEVRRRFRAPIDRVWAIYGDHAGWKEWSGFSRSWVERAGHPDKNGVGCLRGFGAPGVTVFEEVIEWDPPRRMAYRVVRGTMPLKNHHGEVTLATDDGGTLLTWRCRFDSAIPGLGWLLRLAVRRVFRTALEGLAGRHFPDSQD